VARQRRQRLGWRRLSDGGACPITAPRARLTESALDGSVSTPDSHAIVSASCRAYGARVSGRRGKAQCCLLTGRPVSGMRWRSWPTRTSPV
jgi:membrane-associated phospholipid phosphatase